MSLASTSSLSLAVDRHRRHAILKDRAACLAHIRSYFASHSVLEVDCPLSSASAAIDAHIDLVATADGRYLHSSPEYGMKRLLSEGIGDIYQLSHVFRAAEFGRRHNPEFTLLEWYRVAISFEQMESETAEVIQLLLGRQTVRRISYREALLKYAGFDYVATAPADLLTIMARLGITPYPGIEEEGRDALLNLILAHAVEPKLGEEGLCILNYYPASQAALAQTKLLGDELVAERFEIYYKGVELANGYHELADASEQRKRLIEANAHRLALGKQALPIDEHFLKALETGLPDCCGVAVGFDRLVMLRHQCPELRDVLPFAWDIA